MRPIRTALSALCLAAGAAFSSLALAQSGGTRDSAPPTPSAGAARTGQAPAVPRNFDLPALDSITEGSRTIAAGATIPGPVAVRKGDLEVHGTITGDAVAIDGDVVVHQGGLVQGDAVAVRGTVRLAGGSVLGEIRMTTSDSPQGAAAAAPRRSGTAATRHALSLAIGWLAVIAVIGIGVLIFAGDYLDKTTAALEHRFTRSFWIGVAGQLALLPVLLVLIVGLAITLIGILLIPFAIVAYILAVAGLLTLGFLAVARVTGAALTSPASDGRTARAVSLRSLAIGIMVYMGFWVAAAAFAWTSVLYAALTGVAIVITWVAATAGLGAAIISRAGSRAVGEPDAAPEAAPDLSWQTPTPIGGVVAARRPTPRVKETR